MDKNKELTKLEEEKEALQKKIDNLKKCNGQLDFEKFIHSRNTMSSINHMGEITLRVNNIEISLPKISNQEKYYKNMLIAFKVLCELVEPQTMER